MQHVTVTVSESVRLAAHKWAAENNTYISAVIQYCLENLPSFTPAGLRTNGRWPKRGR